MLDLLSSFRNGYDKYYMFHIIYMTTNLVNKKIYIGYHLQKRDPRQFDGYLGSGKALCRAIKKYGEANFIRETLFVFDSAQSALDKEHEIVNEAFIQRSDVYNLTLGGGMPPSQKGVAKTLAHKKKIGASRKGKVVPEKQRIAISKKLTGRKLPARSIETCIAISNALQGVSHTAQRKQNMKDNQPDRSGTNNSMYGKKGAANPNFGRKNTDATLLNMKEASLATQHTIECPHCKTVGKRSGMQRWHFDNCRKKSH